MENRAMTGTDHQHAEAIIPAAQTIFFAGKSSICRRHFR